MRNIRYVGTKPIETAFLLDTGVTWTPGMVDTVLSDEVAELMLRHPMVFQDAGDAFGAPSPFEDVDGEELRADLADPAQGAELVAGTEIPLDDYTALRAYAGAQSRAYITGPLESAKPYGTAGSFQHDPTDTTSADNNMTVLVGADGRRWKRDFIGPLHLSWHSSADPTGSSNSSAAFLQALSNTPTGGTLVVDGYYRVGKVGTIGATISKNITIRGPDSGVGNVANFANSTAVLYFDTDNSDCAIFVNDVQMTLSGVCVSGVGVGVSTGTGIRTTGDNSVFVLDGGARIQSFERGLYALTTDYTRLLNGTITFCRTCLYADGAYNLTLSAGTVLRAEGTGSRCIVLANGSQVTDFGSSIESFQEYGALVLGGSVFIKFGGYYEAVVATPTAWTAYIDNDGTYIEDGVKVYLSAVTRHLSFASSSTARGRMVSRNVEFIPEGTSRTVDIYNFNPTITTSYVDVGRGCVINNSFPPGANNNWLQPAWLALGSFRQGIGEYHVEYPRYNTGAMTLSTDKNTRTAQKANYVLTYSASMTPDNSYGVNLIVANNGSAFTINAPVAPNTTDGAAQELTIRIYNTSGGALGAATWDTGAGGFRLGTWTNPASGFNRTITFLWDGSLWYEKSRAPIDVVT